MKKIVLLISLGFLLVSCGSSFQSFYDTHKADKGTTLFQVPNFMKAVLSNISPEVKHAIGNISDFKYIKFEKVDTLRRQNLIAEMSAVTK
ncbi:DUF4252 domain-containing protein, partial [Algibacter sp.]|nr:DUF4252 domain-containing protein [Algibacter sp.]